MKETSCWGTASRGNVLRKLLESLERNFVTNPIFSNGGSWVFHIKMSARVSRSIDSRMDLHISESSEKIISDSASPK